MGAPKGSSRLLQRIGRANHRLDEPSQGMIVPGNRFEYLEARAALDAIDEGELDPEIFRPGTLDVLAQHILAIACAGPFEEVGSARRNPVGRPLCRPDSKSASPKSSITSRPAAMRSRPMTSSAGWRPMVPAAGGSRVPRWPPSTAQRRSHRRAADDGRPLQERPQARPDRGGLCLDAGTGRPYLLRRPQPRSAKPQGHRHHRPGLDEAGPAGHLRRPAHVHVDPPRRPGATLPRRPQRLAPLPRRRPRMAGGAGAALAAAGAATSCWSRPSRTRSCTSWSCTASRAGTRTSRLEC